MPKTLRRRDFLATSAAAAGSAMAPGLARAVTPSASGKLRTAHIAVGGMGRADLNAVASHPRVEVAALCDVDSNWLDRAHAAHPSAEKFADFRELLDTMGDMIDAVVVSTPDHTHAAAAMTAMQIGKPVYCQKPLTHDVYESVRLRQAAAELGLMSRTQMGIQISSLAVYRRATRMIQGGVIGPVSKVFAWSNKNWGFNGSIPEKGQTPPGTLDWNLWLGTAAERPYVSGRYHPGNWRKMCDFGVGTLGDMGVHIFDTPYRALELTAPLKVTTECRPPNGVGLPERNKVTYQFPGTAHTADTLTWTWYDGPLAPPKPEEVGLPSGYKLPGQGSLFVGEGGMLLLPHVGEAKLLPEEKFAGYRRPTARDDSHYHEWVDACLGKGECGSPFSFGARLTESILLGVIAGRFPGQTLEWDDAGARFTNLPDANALLRRDYRSGFEVAGL